MTLENLIGLAIFSTVGAMTPGPNNLMLLASGVNFGFRRTIPHMIGIAGGYTILLLAVGVGVGALVTLYPAVHMGLKIAGSLYLVYLAGKIAMTRSMGQGRNDAGRPLSVSQAAAFQWVNPKGWVMALSAFAIYGEPGIWPMVVILAVFLATSCISVTSWTAFGSALSTFLADPIRLRRFNILMGISLVLSLWPIIG